MALISGIDMSPLTLLEAQLDGKTCDCHKCRWNT